jgi:hypothetical protein
MVKPEWHHLMKDIGEVAEYFDCELDPLFADEHSTLLGAIIKLPYYPPTNGKTPEFCYLRVTARPTGDGYSAEYQLEKV